MEYIQFEFEAVTEEQTELLIAMLANEGFEGFEEESKSLKAFIPASDFNRKSFDSILNIITVKYSQSIVKEKNWNADWEADFQPVSVVDPKLSTPFAYLRANFHDAEPSHTYDLLVTPKMSFGTGHHATTFMMVSQMSQIDFTGRSVIDFGTGTGVLAILAEKMGASSVLAIDCDDWSINNALENIEANGCNRIKLVKAEMIPVQYKADVILANINLNIIIDNISSIKQASNPGATILFSGIMLHDEAQILHELSNAGISVLEVFRRDNWIAISCVNG